MSKLDWFKIVAALLLIICYLVVVGKSMEGAEEIQRPMMCSGPGSGVNSDICADMDQEWSP